MPDRVQCMATELSGGRCLRDARESVVIKPCFISFAFNDFIMNPATERVWAKLCRKHASIAKE